MFLPYFLSCIYILLHWWMLKLNMTEVSNKRSVHVKVIPVSQKLRHQTALNTPFQTVNHPLDYILFGLFGLWVKYIEPL